MEEVEEVFEKWSEEHEGEPVVAIGAFTGNINVSAPKNSDIQKISSSVAVPASMFTEPDSISTGISLANTSIFGSMIFPREKLSETSELFLSGEIDGFGVEEEEKDSAQETLD